LSAYNAGQDGRIVIVFCLVKFFDEPVKLVAVLLTEHTAVHDRELEAILHRRIA
jgi:hypothetical protein